MPAHSEDEALTPCAGPNSSPRKLCATIIESLMPRLHPPSPPPPVNLPSDRPHTPRARARARAIAPQRPNMNMMNMCMCGEEGAASNVIHFSEDTV